MPLKISTYISSYISPHSDKAKLRGGSTRFVWCMGIRNTRTCAFRDWFVLLKGNNTMKRRVIIQGVGICNKLWKQERCVSGDQDQINVVHRVWVLLHLAKDRIDCNSASLPGKIWFGNETLEHAELVYVLRITDQTVVYCSTPSVL